MKYPTARFKNFEDALKQLEPFIRDARYLRTGKPLQEFYGLRPREIWANWLLCAVLNFENQQEDRFTFFSTTDPIGGDGVIYDTLTGNTFPTEHVFVGPKGLRGASTANTAEALLLAAVEQKQKKGQDAYASGKTLVVFLNSEGGHWFPNVVSTQLHKPLYFADVWALSLRYENTSEYLYDVARLDLSEGNAPTWRIRILKTFDAWEVGIALAVISKKPA